MAKISIRKCEICGREDRSDERHHWTDVVDGICLTMKAHNSIQQELFVGDCCAPCGHALAGVIKRELAEMRSRAKNRDGLESNN